MILRVFGLLSSMALAFLPQNCFAQAVGGTTAPLPVQPAQPVPYSAGTKAIVNDSVDPNYVKCGQECMYSKGNENISLQVSYIQKKCQKKRFISLVLEARVQHGLSASESPAGAY